MLTVAFTVLGEFVFSSSFNEVPAFLFVISTALCGFKWVLALEGGIRGLGS